LNGMNYFLAEQFNHKKLRNVSTIIIKPYLDVRIVFWYSSTGTKSLTPKALGNGS